MTLQDATRWVTIAGGFIAAAVLTVALFVDDPYSYREIDAFHFIHVWSLAWFFTNVVRWLDTHHEAWLRISGLVFLGALLLVYGAMQGNSAGFLITPATANGVALAAASSVIGVTALLSAAFSHSSNAVDRTPMSLDLIGSIRSDPVRWLTIGAGTVLAVSIFLSPIYVPIAVATTCAVRYVDTLPTSRLIRLTGLAVVATVLLVAIVLLWGTELGHVTIPLALLLLACLLAMFSKHDADSHLINGISMNTSDI